MLKWIVYLFGNHWIIKGSRKRSKKNLEFFLATKLEGGLIGRATKKAVIFFRLP